TGPRAPPRPGPGPSPGRGIGAGTPRRQGLTRRALQDPALAEEIAAWAREIAGPDASARRFELACRIAAAQIDVIRVRRARHELFSGNPTATRASRRVRSLRAPCAVTA